MKKTGLLNQALSNVIAGMGHMDTLCVCDAGLPIPMSIKRIDLAVSKSVPKFLDVLDAVLGEIQIEGAIIAEELEQASPEMYKSMMTRLQGVNVQVVSHDKFKQQTHRAKAIARTGEFTPYANVILIAGVVF
ncbi:MAG: D-ribose pyranase [Anaerolineae bacterium]|nr:D-ribose pyranase [Anaerolineae bacterium]